MPTAANGVQANTADAAGEQRAREVAVRYRCEFVDLREWRLDADSSDATA